MDDRSRVLYDRAVHLMPGGVSSPVRAVKPFPHYIRQGRGAMVTDVDGNEFIDLVLGYGPLILGHAHPAVVRALHEQASLGTLYGAPHEKEVLLAERVRKHFPGMEMMRFVSSGTEATMHALRLARGYTGKKRIIKVDGGFHGAHDAVLVRSGSGALTHGSPDSSGVPEEVAALTLVVDYNDEAQMETALKAYPGQVAAIILEPMLGNVGPVPPAPGYLAEVRRLSDEHGAVLIFDEVITGLRLSMGGAQELYGVRPDLTVLGKVLGGGMPMGAFGGSREMMSCISPLGKVYQAGTYSGNPMSLSAALATLEVLESQGLDRLNETGAMVRDRLSRVIGATGTEAIVQGEGSMFQLFFGKGPLRNAQEVLACDRTRYMDLYRRMLSLGVSMPPSQFETCFLSLAHGRDETELLLSAFAEALEVSP
jgi:glutamate-1-semialdehyde 2,1-aminomutase